MNVKKIMTPSYRVEKDGRSFYISDPELLEFYSSKGYSIYKSVEEQVTDIDSELEQINGDNNVAE